MHPVRILNHDLQQKRRIALSSPPPFALPETLAALHDATSTFVQVNDGWLVAIDHGELEGSGLYWLRNGEPSAQRLDAGLLDPIRSVVSTSFGVVGVAGLCHGTPSKTAVYEVISRAAPEGTDGSLPEAEGRWLYNPIALFPGCAGTIASDSDSRSVLIAAMSGGLYEIDEKGMRPIATWPAHLFPFEATSMREAGTGQVYYVSFGNVAARFTNTTADWYAPSDCALLVADSKQRCACDQGQP